MGSSAGKLGVEMLDCWDMQHPSCGSGSHPSSSIATPPQQAAYLCIRGIKTLSLRVKQQNETAMTLAQVRGMYSLYSQAGPDCVIGGAKEAR